MRKLSKEEVEIEKNKKMKYLNEEIISKGYNPEDFSNFIIRTKGMPPDLILFKDYVKIVDNFKSEQLKKTYSSVNSKKEKEQSLFEVFYSPEEYTVKFEPQKPSPLSLIETKVEIKVSNPTKIEGGFFSSSYYTYEVQCQELKTSVIRVYTDFEWLKTKLCEWFPYTIVPPIPKSSIIFGESDINSANLRIRYLNKFFELLTQNKLFLHSRILYSFISLSVDDFNKYRDKLNAVPFTVNDELTNYPSIDESATFSLNRDLALRSNGLYSSLSPSFELYSKLNYALTSLGDSFKNIGTKMTEISDILAKLEVQAKLTQQDENVQKVFKSLSSTFDSWGKGYTKQSEMIGKEFTEFFEYMNLELNMLSTINNDFNNARNEYEIEGQKLKDKKDYLFSSRNYSKWELDPELKVDVVILEKDKVKALDAIYYKETKVVKNMKRKLVFIMNRMTKCYDELSQSQGKRAKDFIEHLAANKADILSDAFSLIKLFSIQI